MAVLVRGGGESSSVYPLGSRCALGRAPTCQVAVLFKDNSTVSRLHAQVERQDDSYFIEDQGSRNGTFVNGRRVTGKQRLSDGDRIGIGNVELTFRDSAGAGLKLSRPARDSQPMMTVCLPVEPPPLPTSLVGCSGEKL